MSDTVQILIVTAVAAGALVTLVRPYLRRPEAKTSEPPCANCAASAAPPTVRRTILSGRSARK